MTNEEIMEYPKALEFESPLDKYKNAKDTSELIRKVVERTKFTLLAENILQIEYPQDLVEEVRTVNVDDMNYRIDFVYRDKPLCINNCFFPKVPWHKKNFFDTKRFMNGKRTYSKNRVVIEYPRIEEKEVTIMGRRFTASRLMPNYQGIYTCTCEECSFGSHCPSGDPFGDYSQCGRVKCIGHNKDEGNYNVWGKEPLSEEDLNRPLSTEEIKLMKHALGLNPWQNAKRENGILQAYRNRYAAQKHSDTHMMWDYLEERGFASSYNDGQYAWFYVTDKGKSVLMEYMGEEFEET